MRPLRVPNLRFFAVLAVAVCTAGCSSQMAYQATQEMQRAQCDKIADLQEQQRCRANARQSYDNYQRERDEVKPAQ